MRVSNSLLSVSESATGDSAVMEQLDHEQNKERGVDDLDALFDAAGTWRPGDARDAEEPKPAAAPGKDARKASGREKLEAPLPEAAADLVIPEADILAMTGADMAGGKFIAIDPGAAKDDDITLVPARVYTYVPLWGWAAIVLGLLVFAAAVIFLPGVSIERLASRLGDDNDIVVQQAMRALVVKGDERTVRTLFDMASSDEQGIKTRLRAVDTMSLIEEMPEVDRSLLRLELASGTNELVREAAIAARRQREAARARGNQ